MISFKRLFLLLAVIAIASCKNASNNIEEPPTDFKEPVVEPLVFSQPKKINWDAIKAVDAKPVIKQLNFNKLASTRYDTTALKPFKNAIEETKFDYDAIPQKDFDVEKIPAKQIKFKTYLLPPPKLIKAGSPQLKNVELSLFTLGEAQGMAGPIASRTFKTKEGFIWIATDQGLYRYDGENFVQFIFGPIDDYIIDMIDDGNGLLWLGTLGGSVEILDIKSGTLKRADESTGLIGKTAFSLVRDERQRIWVAFAPGGLGIIDTKTQTIRKIGKAEGLDDTVTYAAEDKRHHMLVTTKHGLFVIDSKNKKIKNIGKAQGLKSDFMFSLFIDRDSAIWLVDSDLGLTVLDANKHTKKYIKEIDVKRTSSISDISQDNKGRIWVSAFNNGEYIVDPEKQLIRSLKFTDGLSGEGAISLMRDDNDQMWLSINAGLMIVNNDRVVAEHIGRSQTNTLFAGDDGLIWQGTSKGIDILSRKDKTFKHIGVSEGIANDIIETINEIGGKMYVASDGGLDIIDSARNSFMHLGKEQGLHGSSVLVFNVDNAGRIWTGGGGGGITIYDPKSLASKNIGKAEGLNAGRVNDMKKDASGRFWVAPQAGGLAIIDPADWTIKYIKNKPNVLNGAYPVTLFVDTDGDVWLGDNQGVYLADLKANTLTGFSTRQGLIDDRVTSILQHNGDIYVGTRRGVSIIDKKKHKVINSYSIIQNYAGASLTNTITKDGLYWWGDNGLTVLDLSKAEAVTRPVYVTGLNIMDRANSFIDETKFEKERPDTLWAPGDGYIFKGKNTLSSQGYTTQGDITWDKTEGPFNLPENLKLPHNKNFLQFHYSSLNPTNHDTILYRYKLIGADTSWSQRTASTSSRNYFNLAPGEYTFEVTNKSAGGYWSKPASFSFTIEWPWWQKWWAYLLYIICFLAVVWAFVYYRSAQLIKEKKILEHKVHVRTEEVMQQKEEIEAQRDNLEKAIGELRNTQSQLVQSEKLASLGELTAGIAHEIQNPLNFVNNFAEVSIELVTELKEEQGKITRDAETEKELMESLEQNLQKITLHGKRADGIVKNMLQHSRNNTGEREYADVNNLADEYFRLSYHGLRAKDKSFNSAMETHLDGGLPKIHVVPQDIGRVLLNLFNNAFYAVQDKKKRLGQGYQPLVTLATSIKKGTVEIKVRDNGNGIPESIKDKIMQPFFTTKPTGEGTGLGLSLSYEIIKGHNGNIHIDTKEGEFTEFTLSLPVG